MKYLGIFLVIILLGCATVDTKPLLAVSTCDSVENHLTEVGCFSDSECMEFVQKIVKEKITNRMPDIVEFETYCDIALMTGLLPVDCVMKATDIPNILKCI